VKIVDPETAQDQPPGKQGEVWTRGWFVTQGYYKNPEETSKSLDQAGWFHTGDLGVLDEKGYLGITGRLKDMIISGGLNIDPAEVEHLLSTHPAVSGVQVVGLPDRRMGEVVGAFVQLKQGMECRADELLGFCTDKVGKYKIPKHVMFVSDFPATAVGKIQKFRLRDMAIQKLGLKAE